ncbi:hypothetical protein QUW49_02850 [Lacrimispora saccharolytica]|nr:hypothetical protein [Lacrimispora saccharolytica]
MATVRADERLPFFLNRSFSQFSSGFEKNFMPETGTNRQKA